MLYKSAQPTLQSKVGAASGLGWAVGLATVVTLLLDGRAWSGSVRTENAAIARLGLE